jgi:hypothetical protein
MVQRHGQSVNRSAPGLDKRQVFGIAVEVPPLLRFL